MRIKRKKSNLLRVDNYGLSNEISQDEFLNFVNNFDNIEKISNVKCKIIINGCKILNLEYIINYSYVYISKNGSGYYPDSVIRELIKIANFLNASLCDDNFREIPRFKIRSILSKPQKELDLCNKNPVFFEQGYWLAIKSDLNKVVDFFNLEKFGIQWEDYQHGSIMLEQFTNDALIHHYGGWTFIRDNIYKIIDVKIDYSSKKLSYRSKITHNLECLKDKLIELGSYFPEIHYYLHIEKYELRDVFFKVLNGKLKYGYCSVCEPYFNKSWRRKPKEIQNIIKMDARYAAAVWSIYPEELNYYSDFLSTDVWGVRKK